jgi:hypothetical protein
MRIFFSLFLSILAGRLHSVQSQRCVCTCSQPSIQCSAEYKQYKEGRECQIACVETCGQNAGSSFTCDYSEACIGGSNLVYSCSVGDYVAARDVTIGDQLRSLTESGPVCSDVYYVFKHKGSSSAVSIEVEGSFVHVSPDHIVYVGTSFEDRRKVLAKNVSPGDLLISMDGSKKVLSVTEIEVDLVNVLTLEPALVLASGVVVSAHSYHEDVYWYAFYPLRVMYKYFGRSSIEYVLPALDIVDSYLVQPVAALFV